MKVPKQFIWSISSLLIIHINFSSSTYSLKYLFNILHFWNRSCRNEMYFGHAITTWNSSSVSLRLQLRHLLISGGIYCSLVLNLLVYILNLWTLILSLVIFLRISTFIILRYFSYFMHVLNFLYVLNLCPPSLHLIDMSLFIILFQ